VQPPALEALAVSKLYADGTAALSGVSLAVAPGETVALVGESGSGKTTLLRLFNRMTAPTSGTVRIDGEDATGLDPIALRRRTGYAQQEGGLLPHWTAGRNVELVPRLLGWDEAKRRKRTREVLELVGLDPALHGIRYPSELSGGQRQRVAIARALAADPPVVLLDEPFGALDPLTKAELHREFKDLQQDLRKTVLLVTHDLAEAAFLADRIGVLLGGLLLQIDTPENLAARPRHPYVAALLQAAGGSGLGLATTKAHPPKLRPPSPREGEGGAGEGARG
jgi:osmoprotectant transport system ATP-binding protein